ncbi:MAG: hypothetical protein AB1540_16905 [Bdellovibrionota bacterium]
MKTLPRLIQKHGRPARHDSGQALIEYALLTFIMVTIVSVMYGATSRLFNRLEQPIRTKIKSAYKFGDPDACGFDDDGPPCNTGSPRRHPRYDQAENFRLFGRGPR